MYTTIEASDSSTSVRLRTNGAIIPSHTGMGHISPNTSSASASTPPIASTRVGLGPPLTATRNGRTDNP